MWENKPQAELNEFETYKKLPQVNSNIDVLDWWKQHEITFPVIAAIAKVYLAIPASEATCERSFSISKRITVQRESLTPSHVEKLTVLKQNINLFCDNEKAINERI